MAKKDEKSKIEESYGIFRSYDLKVWSHEFFDEETGGFVVGKQNARVVLFQFDKMTERAYLDLLKLVRKGYKVLYFFTEEGIVYDLRNATPQQMMSGRGGDPSAP